MKAKLQKLLADLVVALKELPDAVKGLLSFLAVAGSAVGTIAAAIPASNATATAVVAFVVGGISWLVHFLTNPKVEAVIEDLSNLGNP